jgi:hypothetical protein
MTPSISTTQPMVFSHSMGTNPLVFLSGMLNHDTQPIPWAYNNFSHGMPYTSSHLPSSVSSPYVNLSFGSRGHDASIFSLFIWWESYPSYNSYGRRLEYSFLWIQS